MCQSENNVREQQRGAEAIDRLKDQKTVIVTAVEDISFWSH